ncbi:MAG: endonuclease MutS2 [Oscillospiraceae bacterium]|jgi:DNA mismatch repair protein MutS2|nr:endonuclease MutS2 [Oscillospiraceae bacterium]
MDKKHLRAIELDKVLDMLSKECSCEDTAERALAIEPSSSLSEVEQRLSETWDCHMLIGRFGSPNFGGVKSVTNSLVRARAGACLSMKELLRIADTLRIIRSLREWRGRCEGVATCFDALFTALVPNKYLEESINSAILSEDEMSDNASSALALIRRKMRGAQGRVREQLDKLIRSSSYSKYLQDAIVTQRNGRYVVPVKSECRGDIPGLVHDTSSSGATVFIEPMAVVEANNEIRVLQSEERAEIERILTALSEEAGSFSDSIIAGYEVLLELDLIFAKARLGYTMKAVKPEVNDEGRIKFNKARHPLIDKNKVVSTDITLGDGFDTLVITGPNTGGKTVALKTAGLLSAMAMCGLLLPVSDNSEVSVFDHILADIGDEQSIEQSLSTFSAHMTNIKRIIEIADSKTLVLLDELGAGTDPVEGAALAVSILERLRSVGSVVAATTHYAELKSYAISTHGVENGCCEFDVSTLRPTYRLLIGVPGRSNAFAISERLGIPAAVVDRARELVSSENTKFEEVVETLEKSRQQLETEKLAAQQLRADAEKSRREAELREQRLQKDRDNVIELAKAEAGRIVSSARAQSDALFAEIDNIRKQIKNSADISSLLSKAKSEVKGKMRELESSADPIEAARNENYVLPRPLKAGDTVLLLDINKQGTVLKPPDASGKVEVQAGIIKTRAALSNLRLIEGNNFKINGQIPKYRNTKKEPVAELPREIDVRGMNVEEAASEVDKVIDNALMSGLSEVCVIHGKGTGALRAGLHRHFKHHPNIRTFRLGVFGEGETGVTFLELK